MSPEKRKKFERLQDLLWDACAALDDFENDETFTEDERQTFHEVWEHAYEAMVMLERFNDVGVNPTSKG